MGNTHTGRRGRYERERKRGIPAAVTASLMTCLILVMVFVALGRREEEQMPPPPVSTQGPAVSTTEATRPLTPLEAFMKAHNLSRADYPKSILELLEKNPETEEFVLHYPLEYGKDQDVDMSEFEDVQGVPLFLQWDRRWGYMDYGNNVAGINGCGPTVLAMAAWYLTGDRDMTPAYMLEFAKENGYCTWDQGSEWSLISQGGPKLGLDVVEITPEEYRVRENLEVGNLVVCVVGPGTFTTTGHFILITGEENGRLRINDPNSRSNSEKLWKFSEFRDEILNIWVLR